MKQNGVGRKQKEKKYIGHLPWAVDTVETRSEIVRVWISQPLRKRWRVCDGGGRRKEGGGRVGRIYTLGRWEGAFQISQGIRFTLDLKQA
jgi:hypothetical protein